MNINGTLLSMSYSEIIYRSLENYAHKDPRQTQPNRSRRNINWNHQKISGQKCVPSDPLCPQWPFLSGWSKRYNKFLTSDPFCLLPLSKNILLLLFLLLLLLFRLLLLFLLPLPLLLFRTRPKCPKLNGEMRKDRARICFSFQGQKNKDR